jgi:hypothetical protein
VDRDLRVVATPPRTPAIAVLVLPRNRVSRVVATPPVTLVLGGTPMHRVLAAAVLTAAAAASLQVASKRHLLLRFVETTHS